MLRSWDEGYFPSKKKNRGARFPWKLSRKNHPRLGMFLLVDWSQCSGLNESKKIVARWKIRFGARTAIHNRVCCLAGFCFYLFFSRWTEIERKGQARLVFLGVSFGGCLLFGFQKSLR